MPNKDENIVELKKQLNTIEKCLIAAKIFPLQVTDKNELKNQLKPQILSKMSSLLGKGKIYKLFKNNSQINSIINFADKYLTVYPKNQELKFYKSLSTCSTISTVISII